MKKHLTLSAFICLIIFIFFSCSKHSSTSTTLANNSNSMSATITKSTAITLFSAAGSQYITATQNNYECTIIANDTTGDSVVSNFTFKISNFNGTGQYYIDSASTTNAYYETTGTAIKQTAFSIGTVNILVSGENVSGTFNGTLTDGSVVTNGKFSALGQGF